MNKLLKNTAYALVTLGALNWGFVGLFNFNLVSYLFGDMTLVTRFTYTLIGISSIVAVITGYIYTKKYCIEE